MGLKVGKCTNENCSWVGKSQDVDEESFVCEGCQAPLTERTKPVIPDNGKRKQGFLIAGMVLGLILVGVAGFYVFRSTSVFHPTQESQAGKESPAKQVSGTKSMEKWIEELSQPSIQEPTAPNEYKQVWQTVKRLQERASAITALKQAGKIIGNEHGLLNPAGNGKTQTNILSASEQDMLDQENLDRRGLYSFISQYSNPYISYEGVAYEYAKNQWKEWPPR